MFILRTFFFAALCVAGVQSAEACQREFAGELYSISPYEDDGLSNAEREHCARGALMHYDPERGWEGVYGPDGHDVTALDLAGTDSQWGPFLVVVDEFQQVWMRYGPFDEDFFSNHQDVTMFNMVYPDGDLVYATHIETLHLENGLITLAVHVGDGVLCGIQADPSGTFQWQYLECF